MPTDVFIDSANIHQRATPRRWVTVERTVEWGDETFTEEVLAQAPQEYSEEWEVREVNCLPEVAELAREGRIQLYNGIESRLESISQFSAGISGLLGNPFAGIPTKLLPDAYFEGRVIAGSWRDGDSFMERIRAPNFQALRNNLGDRDAFHLYTADEAGMEYLLTMDRRFRNAVRDHVTVDLQVRVVLPCELLAAIEGGG